jgi:hypothetical protein
MASKTRATEIKRIARDKRMGKKRKAKLRNQGSTLKEKDLFQD